MAIHSFEEIKFYIKGKIAELVFEGLFREGTNFTILPFGYEKSFPELAQFQEYVHVRKMLRTVKHMPDYLLISQDKTEIFFVEVKYMTHLDLDQLEKYASETVGSWDHSWLFVATPKEFYFAPCHEIKNEKGNIRKLSKTWIYNDSTYNKYLRLLKEFEKS